MTNRSRLVFRFASAALLSTTLALATACGGPEEGTPAAAPLADTSAPGATGTASISGKITFEGPVPPAEMVKLSSDAACAGSHPNGMSREDLLVSPEKGLANVFVYVKEGIGGSYPVPSTPVVLDQRGCSYQPHVFGVRAGQPLEIVNSDDTTHNVHAISLKNTSFNLGMPMPNQRVRKTFPRPEVMVKFKCDVHGWMSSYAGVLPHPFFAVSGADGSFAIKDLPAGTYTIEAWHERMGTQSQKVTVGEQEQKSAAFTYGTPRAPA
jgi:plastocyanin